jgi:hypothetical protein
MSGHAEVGAVQLLIDDQWTIQERGHVGKTSVISRRSGRPRKEWDPWVLLAHEVILLIVISLALLTGYRRSGL